MKNTTESSLQNDILENTNIQLNDINIDTIKPLTTLNEMEAFQSLNEKGKKTIADGRKLFVKILRGQDSRFIVITGPCSIHDIDSAKEYATKLKKLSDRVNDRIVIYMRTYFEKPRTTLGWKGLINDPHLNGSFLIEEGLKISRQFLIDMAEIGIYTATELLDPITAAYLAHLVTWSAIGARTTESQIHREMVSGLSTPVGFKNSTHGDFDAAINGMKSAFSPHSFLGINNEGKVSILGTLGNRNTHLVLRGGIGKPNYYRKAILEAENALEKQQFPKRLMVDCSHDNSGKNHEKQADVARDILNQIQNGNSSIFAIMLESHLNPGNQKFTLGNKNLKPGVSITDKCIGWEETEELILEAYSKLSTMR